MLEDHYTNALVRILRKKQAKMPAPPAPVAPSRENVINLMDALRRSIAAKPPAKRPAAASKAARANLSGVALCGTDSPHEPRICQRSRKRDGRTS